MLTLYQSIDSAPGSYALILQAEKLLHIQVGKLGNMKLAPGFYLYFGSARGPGGVKARVNRHLRKQKKLHWHIDYLTTRIPVLDVWYSYAPFRDECSWAEMGIRWTNEQLPCSGFGSSDCRCDAHLVYRPRQPQISEFREWACHNGVAHSSMSDIVSVSSGS